MTTDDLCHKIGMFNKCANFFAKLKFGFYILFNSQGRIWTGLHHCHLWESCPHISLEVMTSLMNCEYSNPVNLNFSSKSTYYFSNMDLDNSDRDLHVC